MRAVELLGKRLGMFRDRVELSEVMALGDEIIGYAHAFKIDALRRLGEMLEETPRNEGGDPVPHRNRVDEPATLADMGLDKKISALAQGSVESMRPRCFGWRPPAQPSYRHIPATA